jgi:CRISPR/Cas system CSM-associated protein Csm3 (group 7 of RAMP superfamily)
MSPEIKKNQHWAIYTVRLTTEQPLHIGAFQDPMSDIHGPFTTLGGKPVVQGSSLKGAARAKLEEYLILNYAAQPAMKPCIPASANNLSEDERALARGQNGKYRGPNCEYRSAGLGQKDKIASLCPACYFYGTMGLVGFVQMPYLYLTGDIEIEEIYQNRRDRGTDTVAHAANRTLQGIPKGAVFEGEMRVLLSDTIRGWELGKMRPLQGRGYADEWLRGNTKSRNDLIQEFVLERVKDIKRIGGQISKGFGNVSIQVTFKEEVWV